MAVYDRDYLTTLPLLYEKASEYSLGDWNKYNNDVGDTILKLIASASHTVDYYFRRFLTASFLPNDDWDQKSLIWELTGYKPNYLRADYLMVQLYWPDCGLSSFVPLYQYTPFKVTADGKEYIFLCAQDYMIPPLTTRFNIRLVNGSLVTIDQDYALIKDNKIKISDDDIDYDLVTVIVSGEKWTQVRNVFYTPDTERIYSVHKESDGIYIYLHSSWQSYLDAYDTSFKILFVKPIFDFTMYTDDCMTVEFDSELLTLDGEDISEYYKIIPLINSDDALDMDNLMPSTSEGNRAITTLDFQTNAALFPGIASVRAYDWNTYSICTTPFEVVLVACDSKGKISEHMKMVLKAYLESICSPLLTVRVVEPQLVRHNLMVLLDIGDYRDTLAEIEIRRLVQIALENFYEIGNLPPGRVVTEKELNSVLLHADPRIYFATTFFMNKPPVSPLLIPVLGDVVIITSAETHNFYDFGYSNEYSYIGMLRFDAGTLIDRFDNINNFIVYPAHAHFVVPIDKLPLQAFETVSSSDSNEFNIPVIDTGITTDMFYSIHEFGGDPDGPQMEFVFETDGTSVLLKFDRVITNTVDASLRFDNSLGTFYVDPDIDSVPLSENSVDDIKAALADAFNNVPGLIDSVGKPFSLTADDITFPGDATPLGSSVQSLKAQILDSSASDKSKVITKAPNQKGSGEVVTGEIQGIDDSKEFNYLPYGAGLELNQFTSSDSLTVSENAVVFIAPGPIPSESYKQVPGRDIGVFKESVWIQKINFEIEHFTDNSFDTYEGFGYNDIGKYIPNPNAYGAMEFTADVNVAIKDYIIKLRSNTGSNLFNESASYNSRYMVSEQNSVPLHWYFVDTTPTHEVVKTTELGYGIYVEFYLQRSSAVYVECDVLTTRGFIYSSECQVTDFTVLNDY